LVVKKKYVNKQSKKSTMSDMILKFWPKEDVMENKTESIIAELTKSGFIGIETTYWDKPAFVPGSKINIFFEPQLERDNDYFNSLAITISEKDYGVVEGEEDFEYVDRPNVVSILGGDGTFEKWSVLTLKLQEITGHEYQGGYELL
jgi:hypothetical protein